jgi:serine/threonine protein kinase/Flp pilus assembly protein TadD
MTSSYTPDDSRERALSVHMQGVKSLVSDLLMDWPDDVPFNARQILAEHPELRDCKSAVVEVVYEEFCRRQEAGEQIDPYQFAQEYPDVRSSLLHLMQVHDFVRTESDKIVWPQPGSEFLGFRLLEQLGKGAFSRVFLAEERDVGNRLVVVKVTTLGRNEAHTLGRLQHPHIVPIHSVKTDPGLGFTVVCMPFLGRATLFDVADAAGQQGDREKRASIILQAAASRIPDEMQPAAPGSEAPFRREWSYIDGLVSLAVQIADGLAYTHDRKFLHCDIKPSNILVTESGRALLFDFNLSFLEDESAALAGGTIPYMAPEQLLRLAGPKQGARPAIDARTDIFCLGATLYELLTGRLPFGLVPMHLPREKLVEHQLGRRRQPGLSWNGVQVEPRLARIVEKCLAFEPENRFQSAHELALALRRELTWAQRARRWVSLHRRLSAAVLLGAFSIAAVPAYQAATREPLAVREFQSAWSAYQARDYRAALPHLDRLLAENSHDINARFLRGVVYLCLEDYPNANLDLMMLEGKIHDGTLSAAIGHLTAEGMKRPTEAVAYYADAIRQGNETAVIRNNLGWYYCKNSDFKNAESCIQKAIQLDPALVVAWENLVRLELVQKSIDGKRVDLSYPELQFDVAKSYAWSARSMFGTENQSEYRKRCVELCRQAIANGLSPASLKQLFTFNPELESDPEFELLMNRPEPQSPRPLHRDLVVNPIERLDQPPNFSPERH